MTYSEPLINQISCFLTSVGFGFVMCLLYMSVRLLFRVISKKPWAVMTGDGAFVILASFISFFFMIISNNGLVRLNLIIGQALGGAVMYFAVGRFLMKYLFIICDALHSVIFNILYPVRVYIKAFCNVIKKLLKLSVKILSKNNEKSERRPRKFKNIAKIHLKSENK